MLPVLPPQLPAGLPSELLTPRPDLLASFARLRATDACLDSALPPIMFTAAGGTRDQALTNLIDPNSLVWNLFAGAFQPLFTGGHVRGGIALAQARATETLHRYKETVLNAFVKLNRRWQQKNDCVRRKPNCAPLCSRRKL
ncbi:MULTISPECIES: Outer membrane protein-like [Nitrosomonas]|uniref:Outer membrane efflux protein n=2 Tax=Nitrosomonas eutropha TaxID=916 RepID=A0ABX5M9G7_9PROT|nr:MULTISPECIES: Outer membrane protein-like [Nitrosomonas]ABI59967.1 Outer membrane protein-like protein [Nitrosomonas eutropha C91]MXS81322.1 hypothetical protein [Nitrosomonas sp. GH22]PXV81576.1 hypothetical protein C8R14_11118 [Nitrosomonas eutropha]SCX25299.1 hypothetical protein SAMN05216379_1274 [Nitrosomonas eutropha]SDX12045.1 hypothetical protein SAMN05216317_1363 [Nitrosomonas eutropha]